MEGAKNSKEDMENFFGSKTADKSKNVAGILDMLKTRISEQFSPKS